MFNWFRPARSMGPQQTDINNLTNEDYKKNNRPTRIFVQFILSTSTY